MGLMAATLSRIAGSIILTSRLSCPGLTARYRNLILKAGRAAGHSHTAHTICAMAEEQKACKVSFHDLPNQSAYCELKQRICWLNDLDASQIFGGWNRRYKHKSDVLGCDMTFSVFFPPSSESSPVPVSTLDLLIWSYLGLVKSSACQQPCRRADFDCYECWPSGIVLPQRPHMHR